MFVESNQGKLVEITVSSSWLRVFLHVIVLVRLGIAFREVGVYPDLVILRLRLFVWSPDKSISFNACFSGHNY